MSTHDILTWIQDSALAHAISKTDHLVGAGLQVVHVMGLVALLASLVLISGSRAAGAVSSCRQSAVTDSVVCEGECRRVPRRVVQRGDGRAHDRVHLSDQSSASTARVAANNDERGGRGIEPIKSEAWRGCEPNVTSGGGTG